MKKILTIVMLLSSTLLNAYWHSQSNLFNHHVFGDNFWNDFGNQFQQFDHQIDRLRYNDSIIRKFSKQYFDKDNNSYVMEIKISGVNKKNLDISSNQNMLIIKVKQTLSNNNTYSSNNFSQIISIPVDGDVENITAIFESDVLKVIIPKLMQPKPKYHIKKITIK